MEARQFKCELCTGIFNTTVTEEEKISEYKNLTGRNPGEDIMSVCEDCYQDALDFMSDTDYLNIKNTMNECVRRYPEK